jgi:hypothetical protein
LWAAWRFFGVHEALISFHFESKTWITAIMPHWVTVRKGLAITTAIIYHTVTCWVLISDVWTPTRRWSLSSRCNLCC